MTPASVPYYQLPV